MTAGAHGEAAAALPAIVPLFPLSGVLMLPRAELPLHVFEPRYRAMTRDAAAGERLIGIVQPLDPGTEHLAAPALYTTGGVGRISHLEETADGRFFLTLTGLCRFDIVDELALSEDGYRRARVDYGAYVRDFEAPDDGLVERDRLLAALRRCVPDDERNAVDWAAIERMPSDNLVTALAMGLPFGPGEKQALLEAAGPVERAAMVVSLTEMMALESAAANAGARLQ